MDGHAAIVLPNQHFTMTDQLRSGARLLTLDLQPVDDNARLCHAFRPDGISLALCEIPNLAGVTAGMRFYANGIKEIANWMNLNRREIVFINTEDYVGTPYLLDPLEAYLGDKLLPSPLTAPPGFTNARWPTRREMLAGPSRAIAFTKSGQHTPLTFGESNVVGGFSDNWYATNLKCYPGCPAVDTFSAAADTDRFQVTGSIGNGDLIHFKAVPGAALPDGVVEGTPYYVVTTSAGTFGVAAVRSGLPIDVTADGSGQILISSRMLSSITVEDREWGRPVVGILESNDVKAAAECNYSFITLDQFSVSGIAGSSADYSRQGAAVWSWEVNDRGDEG